MRTTTIAPSDPTARHSQSHSQGHQYSLDLNMDLVEVEGLSEAIAWSEIVWNDFSVLLVGPWDLASELDVPGDCAVG
jgi:hypothetical protein